MCARLTEEHLCRRMCDLHYWECVTETVGLCALFNEQTTAAFIMKELEHREQEENERNEEEKKRSTVRAHWGPNCVCYGSVCEMKMKRGVGSVRTVIHRGRLGQACGGYILHTSTEENTTVMQVCLVALKWQMNAKHNIWIGLVDLWDFASLHPSTE